MTLPVARLFLQTFKFLRSGLLFVLFHDRMTASDMTHGVDLPEHIPGKDVFREYVHVLFTDCGPEFSDSDGMERDSDQIPRTRVFCCNPMQPGQKGSPENKHVELRYILPNGVDLRAIGLIDQNQFNLALSRINSAPVQILAGKSPLEVAEFLVPNLFIRLNAFGVSKKRRIGSF